MPITRIKIVKEAALLFREKGYSAVTMRDLAAVLNIKAASLYNHISSKQEILQEIIITIAREFTSGMIRVKNLPLSNVEKLKLIVHLHVDLAIKNPNGMSALNSDWMHLKDKLDEYFKMRDDYEANFRMIVKAGMESGEIKNLDIDVIAYSMLTSLRSLYLWIPKIKTQELGTFSDGLAEVLISGINT